MNDFHKYENIVFSKKDTLFCKGIAVCLLLFHHLFFNEQSWDYFEWSVVIGQIPLIAIVAQQARICLAIFIFLSSYGLAYSYNSFCFDRSSIIDGKQALIFSLRHASKLYGLYWPVFIIGCITGIVTNIHNPFKIYNSALECIYDFLGIEYIIYGKSPLNGAWWYISFALLLYFSFPLIYLCIKKRPIITGLVAFLVGVRPYYGATFGIEIQRYLFVVVFAILCSYYGILNSFLNWNTKRMRLIISGNCMILGAIVHYFCSYTFDGIYVFFIISFMYNMFRDRYCMRKVFIIIGAHSANIFLIHGFFFAYYLHDYVYGFRNPLLIWFILLLLTIIASVSIEKCKKIIVNITDSKNCEISEFRN